MLHSEHYKNVLAEPASAPGRVLFIQDGSELIYNNLKWIELGPTADSNDNGILPCAWDDFNCDYSVGHCFQNRASLKCTQEN